MRLIGVLLILAGVLVGWELVYKGRSLQQLGHDVAAFFHVPTSGSSAPQGWSGQAPPADAGSAMAAAGFDNAPASSGGSALVMP